MVINMKNKTRTLIGAALCIFLCITMLISLTGCDSGAGKKSALNPDDPVTVTVWNYYNGDQLEAFNRLVNEFNSTVGLEKGIVVVCVSHGDIDTLANSLISSVNGEAGAQETPSLAAVYAETAYILNKADALAPMDEYFSADELGAYVKGFLDEGRFGGDNELLLFPIIKSTELFTANKTDWEPFAAATGFTLESITTKEKLTEAAEAYYEWTDSLTPDIPEDGKALYGRDSVSNYIYIGTYQLGHAMFTVTDGELAVDLDRAAFKTLWDNYYIPYINGYFGSYARFRSEDCKTGKILALTSSSSSAGYLPTSVTLGDDNSHEINTYVSCDLPFSSSNGAVVQQGASYCLLKSTPAQQEGAVEFLKWFTKPERNLSFALMSGYSPVTLAANNVTAISEAYDGDTSTAKGQNVLSSLLISSQAFSEHESYAVKPFDGSKEVRYLLGDLFENAAKTDRAAVAEAIKAGKTREEATAPYTTDAYFDAFFNDLCEKVNATVKG